MHLVRTFYWKFPAILFGNAQTDLVYSHSLLEFLTCREFFNITLISTKNRLLQHYYRRQGIS